MFQCIIIIIIMSLITDIKLSVAVIHLGLEKWTTGVFIMTPPDIDWPSKLIRWNILWTICSKAVVEDPTAAAMCRYTTLWNTNSRKLSRCNLSHYLCAHEWN